jgi:hypothetical protein
MVKIIGSKFWQQVMAVAVFVFAFLSYNYNLFNVTSDEWFYNNQSDSEQLVLDGLLHSIEYAEVPMLGRYSRPSVENQQQLARDLYNKGETSGEFQRYKSQYGLQLKALAALNSLGLGGLHTFYSIVAALMSLVVAAMFILVRTAFSSPLALVFASGYIFSPWIVVFARNLYWVPFTWFLPMLTTMALSANAYRNVRLSCLMFGALFSAYLLKLLCGYEYLTTIFLASCAPSIYFGVNTHCTSKEIVGQFLINVAALLFAFSSALLIHAHSIKNGDESGLSHIALTAKKRMYDDKPLETAKAVCAGDAECEKVMAESLLSNPIKVTAKYFLFPDFIPWASAYQVKKENKNKFKTHFQGGFTISQVATLGQKLGLYGIIDVGLYGALKALSFLGFVFLTCMTAIFFRRFDLGAKCALAVSLLAPLSWFLAAKGHSYIHYHINYVLWYVPFVPFCMLAMASIKSNEFRRALRVPVWRPVVFGRNHRDVKARAPRSDAEAGDAKRN